jgi:diadenosine tetraphosphate (Ap4A) HIT family hydrolase
MGTCHICADNASQDLGEEKWSVARLTTGYVRLNPNQYFHGSCFFLAKSCIHELHDFDRVTRDAHLAEMAEVAAAIWTTFTPKKLNYEALGNGAPHLHWWLTPRYESDPRPFAPIWEDLESCERSGRMVASQQMRRQHRFDQAFSRHWNRKA